MKKILRIGTLLLASSSFLSASPATLYEIAPKNYNKQVFTFGIDSFSERQQIDGAESRTNLGSSLAFNIANKATLKKLDYKAGEFYWRGKGYYGLDFNEQTSSFGLEIGTGLSYNLSLFYTNLDLGGRYTYKKLYIEDTQGGEVETNDKGTELFVSGTIGFPISKKIHIGVMGEYAKGSVDFADSVNKDYNRYTIGLPISYNIYSDIAVDLTYSFSTRESEDKTFDVDQNKIFLGVSWSYPN
jgi:opacity protein-like surface antigen